MIITTITTIDIDKNKEDETIRRSEEERRRGERISTDEMELVVGQLFEGRQGVEKLTVAIFHHELRNLSTNIRKEKKKTSER